MVQSISPLMQAQLDIAAYFQASVGQWRSQRRYYTLKSDETQEVISSLKVEFLAAGSPELLHLAQLHELPADIILTCGALTSWESNYISPSAKQSTGSTVFGVLGDLMYRDRGFATNKPVTAKFHLQDSRTLCLRTQYGGSIFEEEVKLVGSDYRTRQTIISRAGEEIMIGQYLEKRMA
jgi:CpeS-like protein